jgi:hypothetical protein
LCSEVIEGISSQAVLAQVFKLFFGGLVREVPARLIECLKAISVGDDSGIAAELVLERIEKEGC